MSIATDIEEHRAHLVSVGYRMTGSLADAEDAVQDAWLRLNRLSDEERARIRDPRAWLTTVVGRLCLDRLRSASARRESYIGPWLPEPLVSTADEDDPLAVLVREEEVRMAAMVVLDQLTPPQRVAFVLHDALALTFGEIAQVLSCSIATARQHASRARRAVAAAHPPPRAAAAEQLRLLTAVADALSRGDTQSLVALLHPDAVLVSDSGGMTPAARREVYGADKVARLLVGLSQRYGEDLVAGWAPVLVNGEQGWRSGGHGGAPESVSVFSVRDGQIVAIYSMLNPAKLAAALDRTDRPVF
ncbi:MAG TPA: RNA polymerase sigma factor SigJ [Pseudonocardia sp.]|uniref:RNA polymerase sigma factor SigJ n=1 Tax=Pseudonocardia sp. TaxID=60912 RepID=UPI002C75A7AD|nr:RNA polymerase sigma factor SigJ [Pseudonocardia sp.]HTF48100.1 RNA polymerase sigma factor SigJ [Pseudonocardia sp.]